MHAVSLHLRGHATLRDSHGFCQSAQRLRPEPASAPLRNIEHCDDCSLSTTTITNHTTTQRRKKTSRELQRESRKDRYVPNEHFPNPPCHGTTHPLFRIPQQHIEVGVRGRQTTAVFHAPLEPHDHRGADQGGEKGLGVYGVQRAPAPCLCKATPADQNGVRKEALEPCCARKKGQRLARRRDTRTARDARRTQKSGVVMVPNRGSPHRNSRVVP